MTDSDDETFLLAALEQLEEKEKSCEPLDSEILTNVNYEDTISHNGSINELSFSTAKHLSSDKETNFRANLLKSLKSYQTNNAQKPLVGNSTLKRKHENNREEFSGSLENEDISSSNKNIDEFKPKEPQRILDHDFISIHKNTNIKKRKFPGPAGLLPEMGSHPVKHSLALLKTSEFNEEVNNQTLCSQTTAQDFVCGPWEEMCTDLRLFTDVNKFFKNHNIKNLSRKNPLRSQASIRKVSVIAIMVRSLDLSHHDATAIFCDQTGEIRGTISKDVIEKYGELICGGTVFLLKDATILSPAVLQSGVGILGQLKKHYLTITLDSIVTIYSPIDNDGTVNKTKVLTLKNDEFELLVSSTDDDDKERKELIENEENEQRISVFEKIGCEKNKNSPVVKYSGNSTNFKSPYVTNINKKVISSVPQSSTRPMHKELNFQVEKNAPSKSVASTSKKFNFNSINNNFNMAPNNSNSFNSSNINTCHNAKDKGLFNESNHSNIKSTSNVIADSLSDDDELDTLLASIDTDML